MFLRGSAPSLSCLFASLARHASTSATAVDPTRLLLASAKVRQRLEDRSTHRSTKRIRTLAAAETTLRQRHELARSLHAMTQDSDPDMRALAEADYASATTALAEAYTSLRTLLTPSRLSSDTHALVELSPGVGGLEAAHFTDDLGSMLVALAARHDWHCTVHRPDELDEATAGATATGETAGMSLQIKGDDAYNVLRLEAGVHRVQRVPATETKGRTHTSTAAIVVLPVPSASDRDEAPLYGPNDLVFTNMRSSGAGGQRTNKVETAVRIVHTPTGHAIKCQEYRMQMQNREAALMRMEAYLRQLRVDEEARLVKDGRAGQVTGTDRSDKIRTYNFPQDRVTDHRVPVTVHGVASFLEAGDQWDTIHAAVSSHEVDEHIRGILGE